MYLGDLAELTASSRRPGADIDAFVRHPVVAALGWPEDVVQQWLYDHADHEAFHRDYGAVDLSSVQWTLEAVSTREFMSMSTGAAEADCIETYAEDPDHWVRVRSQPIHAGVAESWRDYGTWKCPPILVDRGLLTPHAVGLQVVEGRTRVGVLRGRQRQGGVVATHHLAWVGRLRD